MIQPGVEYAIVDTAHRILGSIRQDDAERADREGWHESIWRELVEVGFPWIGVSDRVGGVGGTLSDAVAVLRLVGYHGVSVPLAECGLLAGWLLEAAGVDVVNGVTTVVTHGRDDRIELASGCVSGIAYRVPWARFATRIVAVVEGGESAGVAVVDAADVTITRGANLAGEARDTVHFADSPAISCPVPPSVTVDALRLRGAFARAVVMAGASERVTELTTAYTATRRQFGRPIAGFQAVQALLVDVAECSALATVAVDAATQAVMADGGQFEMAAAKLAAGEGAERATRAAHQAHGAIGTTREYLLHRFTRRLWGWQQEFGSDRDWQRWIGDRARAAGADGLYGLICDGRAEA
jgi:acyl-CoA dehydrogenase